MGSNSQPCPSEESSTPCTLERNWGISRVFGAFLAWQLPADLLLHPAPSWPWKELGGLTLSGGNAWGLCKYKDLISALFLSTLVLQGLEEDSSLSICSLAAQIILTLTEKNITAVIYPTNLALQGLKSMGKVAPILGSSLRAAMPVLGCPALGSYLSVLESLGCSWHFPFACRAAPPLQHIPCHYCAVGSPLCCVFP